MGWRGNIDRRSPVYSGQWAKYFLSKPSIASGPLESDPRRTQSLLVLTRKTTEVIRVGNDVQLIVLAIKGNEVRLGIVAPLDVVVDREEVAKRKRRERDQLAR